MDSGINSKTKIEKAFFWYIEKLQSKSHFCGKKNFVHRTLQFFSSKTTWYGLKFFSLKIWLYIQILLQLANIKAVLYHCLVVLSDKNHYSRESRLFKIYYFLFWVTAGMVVRVTAFYVFKYCKCRTEIIIYRYSSLWAFKPKFWQHCLSTKPTATPTPTTNPLTGPNIGLPCYEYSCYQTSSITH